MPNTSPVTRIAHAAFGAALTLAVWRALEQAWVPGSIADPWAVAAVRGALVFAAAAGSLLSLAAGWIGRDERRALAQDALSALAFFAALLVLALGGLSREVVGIVLVLAVAVRLLPAAWWTVRHGAPPLFVLALCFALYAPLAGWRVAASLPFGDQVFYLTSAERLAHGSLDATIDPLRFFQILGVPPQPVDTQTHVIDAPAGPRLIQGYALPALVMPGWLLGGEVGATLVIALFAAWAALQTWLLLGETVADARTARLSWALVAFCAPLALLAVHVYPNAVAAALVVTGYRHAFTARERRPLLAGALLGATALLTPRDALVVVALLPSALRWPRAQLVRAALGGAALVAVAALVSLVTFGVPLPYAGYVFGTGTAATIQPEPFWTFHFWVGLPAILFDRVFGIAGTAPWTLLGALGLVPALRAARTRLLPGALAIAATLFLLSLTRLWEGGYAPPARYLVDVLPLWAPFVAFGLAAARGLVLRAFAGVVVATSVLMTAFLLAVPSAALNTAFEDKPQQLLTGALGLDPLGWLPSFQPVTPDWWVVAYLRLVPAVAIVAALVWAGRRGRVPAIPLPLPHWRLAFVLASVAALAWTGVAVSQPWVAAASPFARQLVQDDLVVALTVAALATMLLASRLPDARRRAFLVRHMAIYLAVPFLLFALGQGTTDVHVLGAFYLLPFFAWALHALEGLWHVIPGLTDRTAGWLVGAVLLVPFLALLPYEAAAIPTASDEPHYLVIVQSLVDDRDLDLRDQYDRETYRSYYDGTLPDRHVIQAGPRQYPIRDLGLPVLAALPFAVAGRGGVLVLLCLAGAALGAQLYRACRDLGVAPRPALLAVGGAGLAHPLLTYTTQISPDLVAALAFVGAARLLRHGRAASLGELAGASALVGVLPWLSTRAWLVAVGLGLVVAYAALRPLGRVLTGPRAERAAAGALPFAALVLLLCYVNYRMFGFFIPGAGYYLISDQQQVLAFAPQIGALGLLFDQAFGLVPRTPLYLLCALGVVPLFRRAWGAELAALLFGWLAYFLYIADIAYWHADGSPPSRYLLGGLPFLVVLLAAGIERLGAIRTARAVAVAAAWALGAYSLLVAFVYAVDPSIRYDLAVNVRATGSEGALFAFLGRILRPDPAVLFPSLIRAAPSDLALGFAWLALVVALVAFTWRRRSASG